MVLPREELQQVVLLDITISYPVLTLSRRKCSYRGAGRVFECDCRQLVCYLPECCCWWRRFWRCHYNHTGQWSCSSWCWQCHSLALSTLTVDDHNGASVMMGVADHALTIGPDCSSHSWQERSSLAILFQMHGHSYWADDI